MATKREKHAIRRKFTESVIFSQLTLTPTAATRQYCWFTALMIINDKAFAQGLWNRAEAWAKANCPQVGKRCVPHCSLCVNALDSIIGD